MAANGECAADDRSESLHDLAFEVSDASIAPIQQGAGVLCCAAPPPPQPLAAPPLSIPARAATQGTDDEASAPAPAVFFLFGREAPSDRAHVSGRWSDFGGRAEAHERPEDTAAREFFEESMGLAAPMCGLGPPAADSIARLAAMLRERRHCARIDVCLNHGASVSKHQRRHYVTFVVPVAWDPSLPERFARLRRALLKIARRCDEVHSAFELVVASRVQLERSLNASVTVGVEENGTCSELDPLPPPPSYDTRDLLRLSTADGHVHLAPSSIGTGDETVFTYSDVSSANAPIGCYKTPTLLGAVDAPTWRHALPLPRERLSAPRCQSVRAALAPPRACPLPAIDWPHDVIDSDGRSCPWTVERIDVVARSHQHLPESSAWCATLVLDLVSCGLCCTRPVTLSDVAHSLRRNVCDLYAGGGGGGNTRSDSARGDSGDKLYAFATGGTDSGTVAHTDDGIDTSGGNKTAVDDQEKKTECDTLCGHPCAMRVRVTTCARCSAATRDPRSAAFVSALLRARGAIANAPEDAKHHPAIIASHGLYQLPQVQRSFVEMDTLAYWSDAHVAEALVNGGTRGERQFRSPLLPTLAVLRDVLHHGPLAARTVHTCPSKEGAVPQQRKSPIGGPSTTHDVPDHVAADNATPEHSAASHTSKALAEAERALADEARYLVRCGRFDSARWQPARYSQPARSSDRQVYARTKSRAGADAARFSPHRETKPQRRNNQRKVTPSGS